MYFTQTPWLDFWDLLLREGEGKGREKEIEGKESGRERKEGEESALPKNRCREPE